MDYLNHKVCYVALYLYIQYYYENMKDINEVLNEEYHLEPETALDVLIATIKLQC